jgi:hypothetical protein
MTDNRTRRPASPRNGALVIVSAGGIRLGYSGATIGDGNAEMTIANRAYRVRIAALILCRCRSLSTVGGTSQQTLTLNLTDINPLIVDDD